MKKIAFSIAYFRSSTTFKYWEWWILFRPYVLPESVFAQLRCESSSNANRVGSCWLSYIHEPNLHWDEWHAAFQIQISPSGISKSACSFLHPHENVSIMITSSRFHSSSMVRAYKNLQHDDQRRTIPADGYRWDSELDMSVRPAFSLSQLNTCLT